MTAVCAGLAALAVWLLVPARPRGLRRIEAAKPRGSGRFVVPVVWCLVAVACLLVLAAGGAADLALWCLVVTVAGGLVAWLVSRARRRRREVALQRQVAEACQVVAGQLAIGQVPARALEGAAEDCAVVRPVVTAQRVGASVPDALREESRTPGADGLAALASAWELSARLGAPTAALASAVADGLHEEERLHETVATELSATRATGKVLALLPVVGVMMAGLVGADPGHFLLATWPGRVCVVVGVVLTCAGVVWTETLADRAGRTS
ncbi:type II secretion system F family protein [Aestuariimicrobium soli]|uniref:type II secretion system F family protein n=1 Tax=Aestuariimicrobium soli TaxID=2035834 RepID=UPI003EBF9989